MIRFYRKLDFKANSHEFQLLLREDETREPWVVIKTGKRVNGTVWYPLDGKVYVEEDEEYKAREGFRDCFNTWKRKKRRRDVMLILGEVRGEEIIPRQFVFLHKDASSSEVDRGAIEDY